MTDLGKVGDLLERAREIGIAYYRLTGRPLGITGEIGEYEVARRLGYAIAPVREKGFDMVDPAGAKIQVKARCLPPGLKALGGQKLGSISLDGPWQRVAMVLMDHEYRPISIHEAERDAIVAALTRPGSKARNERGALSVTKFKSLGRKVWPPEEAVALGGAGEADVLAEGCSAS